MVGSSSLSDPSLGPSEVTRMVNVQAFPSYLSALIVANSPQLLLSFCYFVYNAFFTRMQVEKEWASYSTRYKPLRVSDPKGDQWASYRLSLPYKYSLPLMALSALLHWLVSNTLFMFVVEGGEAHVTCSHSDSANTGQLQITGQDCTGQLLAWIVQTTG